MFGSGFKNTLVAIFALRQRRDYIVKPLCILLAYLVVFAVATDAMTSPDPATLFTLLAIAAISLFPFMCLAYVLVQHLDQSRDQLGELALTDPLTALPNRRAFLDAAHRQQSNGTIGYILILDADHFKSINDTHGHAIGDVCLRAIAEGLVAEMRPHDIVGRIGGEEFGAYLPFATQADLLKIERRLCQTIRVALDDAQPALRVSLSIGAAETWPEEPAKDALVRADAALYNAKESGRGQLQIWNKQLRKTAS